MDPSIEITNRTTYSLLDWLGDVGGLVDALSYLIKFCLGPYLSHSYATLLLGKFFRAESAQPQQTAMNPFADDTSSAVFKQRAVKHALMPKRRLPSMKFIPYFLTKRCSRSRRDFNEKLKRSQQQFDRELDLRHFIARQRRLITAVMSLLSAKQRYLVSKMSSKLLLCESQSGGEDVEGRRGDASSSVSSL